MKKQRIVNLAVSFVLATCSFNASAQTKYEWQNPQMPIDQRVESLLKMLTPEEKVGLMMNKSMSVRLRSRQMGSMP